MFNTILYTLLGTLAVVGLIYLMIKVPKSRYFVVGACWIIACGFAVFCGYHLNIYYNEKGGIFGAITGIFETNVVVVDDLNFSMQNLELLKKSEDDDTTFVAKAGQNKVLSQLTSGQSYTIFVNGVPVTDAEYASDYLFAKYEYTFFDETMTEICSDTLEIRFAFDKNFTTLILTTNGGEQSAKLWNSYFNRNFFEISIKISDFIGSDSEVVPGEYDADKLAHVNYYVDNALLLSQVYIKGMTILSPKHDIEDFVAWTTSSSNIWTEFDFSGYVNDDLTLYAVLNNSAELTCSFKVINDIACYQSVVSGDTLEPVDVGNKEYYTIEGWTLDGENIVDYTTMPITKDTTFIAKIRYAEKFSLTTEEQTILNNFIRSSGFRGTGYGTNANILAINDFNNRLSIFLEYQVCNSSGELRSDKVYKGYVTFKEVLSLKEFFEIGKTRNFSVDEDFFIYYVDKNGFVESDNFGDDFGYSFSSSFENNVIDMSDISNDNFLAFTKTFCSDSNFENYQLYYSSLQYFSACDPTTGSSSQTYAYACHITFIVYHSGVFTTLHYYYNPNANFEKTTIDANDLAKLVFNQGYWKECI